MTATVLIVEDDAGVRLAVQRDPSNARGTRSAPPPMPPKPWPAPSRSRPTSSCSTLASRIKDGFDVMASLRRSSEVPILLLTGRDSPMDRVYGLDQGADDYLVKPASLLEIAARVRALLRRAPPGVRGRLRDDARDLDVDLTARSVTLAGKEVLLSRLEFDLVVYLLRRPGHVVSRDELLEKVWDSSPEYQSSAVITEYILRLRRKLGELPFTSVRGIGYRYDPVPTS